MISILFILAYKIFLPPVVWNSGEAVAGIGNENDNCLLSRQNE